MFLIDVRDGHRLSGPRDAKEGLEAVTPLETGGQLGDGPGLVTGGAKRSLEIERGRGHA